jgi:hypothetical protein
MLTAHHVVRNVMIYEKLKDHNVKHIIVVYVVYHFILKHILGDHNNPNIPHVNYLIYYQLPHNDKQSILIYCSRHRFSKPSQYQLTHMSEKLQHKDRYQPR